MEKTLRAFAQLLLGIASGFAIVACLFALPLLCISVFSESNGSGAVYMLASLLGVLSFAFVSLSLLVALDR